jgi:hypothetical protein
MATIVLNTPTLGTPSWHTLLNANFTTISNYLGDCTLGSGITSVANFLLREHNAIGTHTVGQSIAEDWKAANGTHTFAYLSSTSIRVTVSGGANLSATYCVGRRIQYTNSTAKIGLITAVIYSNPNTDITVSGDTVANAAITTVKIGVISPFENGLSGQSKGSLPSHDIDHQALVKKWAIIFG